MFVFTWEDIVVFTWNVASFQQPFIFSHKAYHLFFKRLEPTLALILDPLFVLLLLSLESMLTMLLMIILHRSLSLLCCRSI